MATTSSLQAVPLPTNSDPVDVVTDLAQIVDQMEPRLVMRFSSTGARDVAITAPQNGMVAYITGDNVFTYYEGTAWRKGNFARMGLAADRPAAAAVPEGTLYYETDQNLLKGRVGASWIILNATTDVDGSDTNASAQVLTTTEKVLHTVVISANPDYALEVFVMGYCSFGGGSTADDIEIRLRNGTGIGGTLKAYGVDGVRASGWGSVAVSDTLTIAKGAAASARTFVVTGQAITGGTGHAPRANAQATGIDFVASPKNL